jgi:tetratricopeptide (TPR) repeat protein
MVEPADCADRPSPSEMNRKAALQIARTIARSPGQFVPIFARCNYGITIERALQTLADLWPEVAGDRGPLRWVSVTLGGDRPSLFHGLQQAIAADQHPEPPAFAVVFGLSGLEDLEGTLVAANVMRNEFQRGISMPVVLWLSDGALATLVRIAPDFYSYGTTKRFEADPEDLAAAVATRVNGAMDRALEIGAGRFLATDGAASREVAAARQELRDRRRPLGPALEAGVEFVLAQNPDLPLEASKVHYERSLALFRAAGDRVREGCVWFYLNLWWRRVAVRQRDRYDEAYGHARYCCDRALACFRAADRDDLTARFVSGLCAVLQRQKAWEDLERVASQAMALHRRDPIRLAYDCGSLAMVALARDHWDDALTLTDRALALYGRVRPPRSGHPSGWERFERELQLYHQEFYLYLRGRALTGLGRIPEAIDDLNRARATGHPEYEPELYVRILETLRQLLFAMGDYRQAYEVKQERQAIEAEYGFRPFAGAVRLRPLKRPVNPAWDLGPRDRDRDTAAGREEDVRELVRRVAQPRYKLIVLHGASGVGKSSLLWAGLVPALARLTVDGKTVIPVPLRRYGNWARDLSRKLARETQALLPNLGTWEIEATPEAIAAALRVSGQRNCLTVLIFDQLEEFFFEGETGRDRRVRLPFYQFIGRCMALPDVKVIFSLREDYLHCLLELDRLTDLGAIDEDILRRDVRYALGDFCRDRARNVLINLTARSQFYLEPDLIDALVEDLAADLGEVRPIELQVVGAQLQSDGITTLAAYRQLGKHPKQTLVARSLAAVIADCGPPHERLAAICLYLLTNEQNLRPLRTRRELEKELHQLDLEPEPATLSLILDIFVGSGLAFLVPEETEPYYQLVHDYLVPFIRDRQGAEVERLRAALENDRQYRRLERLRSRDRPPWSCWLAPPWLRQSWRRLHRLAARLLALAPRSAPLLPPPPSSQRPGDVPPESLPPSP